jgi:hypothetical protein
MSKIKGILLIPEEGDPHRLIAEGACGARSPVACWDGERWKSWTDNASWWPLVPDLCAFVLAWDGDVIQEGLDKAITTASMELAWYKMDYEVLSQRIFWLDEIVQWVGAALAELLSCTLVLIDADGREIKSGG